VYRIGSGLHGTLDLHLCFKPGGLIVLDKKITKSDTYRAPTKPMSAAPKFIPAAPAAEDDSDLRRLAESLATDPEMIAKVRASLHALRRQRILTMQQAFRQAQIEEALSPR